MIGSSMVWRADGACVGTGTDLFFPGPNDAAAADMARAICESCPVRSQCYDHALRHEEFGVWAGTSERQRRQLRKQLGIHLEDIDEMRYRYPTRVKSPAACGTDAGYHRHLRITATEPCERCRASHARAEAGRARRRIRRQLEKGGAA